MKEIGKRGGIKDARGKEEKWRNIWREKSM